MKVCFLAHASNLTGANNSMLNLIFDLQKRNIEPYVIIPKKGLIEKKLKEFSIPYKIIKSYSRLNKIGTKNNIYKDTIKQFINKIAIIKIKKVLKQEKIELVHINSLINYVGAKAANECKIPYIWHYREFLDEDHGYELVNKKEVKYLANNATATIAISKCIYNKFESLLNNDNFKIIYNGIPLNNYQNYNLEITKESLLNICIIGRISRGKGQLDAIKAVHHLLKIYPTIKLYVIGSPEDDIEYNDEITKYVESNSLSSNIIFIPFTENLYEYRNKCKINLVCSKKEAFGRVTIEAMLSNQLVIASNTGGNIELVEDKKTGLLYKENDYINLAEKIEFAINNEKEIKKIITTANKHAKENFSIDKTVDNVYNLYLDILK